jgi:hypothetical protein
MGKLYDRLQKQLSGEHKQDAEDCLRIYNHLKETTGHVWESEWRILVSTIYKGFPSDERRFKPTTIGYTYIQGMKETISSPVKQSTKQ